MRQGSILHINLSDLSSQVEKDEALFNEFMGGTSVGTELLLRHGLPDRSAYDAEAPIIFAIGPLSGLYPVATKVTALFKSPLSGDLGESHAGGRMAMAMRDAGIDALVITGRASSPLYLSIHNHEVSFCSASTFWGNSATSTERVLHEAESMAGKKVSIVRIGPAGERCSPIACATVDGSRHFGRTGLGGVMGSKNLKAIVLSGDKGVVIDKNAASAYREVYDTLYDRVVNSQEMRKYHDVGTAINVSPLSAIQGLPTRNFSQGSFEGAASISGETFAKNLLSQHTACAHCQCGCIHLANLREEYKEWHYRSSKVSYDYELIYSLGSVLSISDPQAVLKLILEVERQGWDAISMGVTLAWATEAYVSGTLSDETVEGLPLAFGDADCYLEMMRRCASGKGEFFRDLEKGSAYCSEKWGGAEFAVHYGGVEPGGYMTGENFIITSMLGVRHSHLDDTGYSIDQKLLNKEQTLKEQVSQQVKEARWRMVLNSLVICLFARGVYDREIILQALNAVAPSWDSERLDKLAASTLKRKYEFRKRCGFKIESVNVPAKMFQVRSATGRIDAESIAERVKLYRELADI